MGDSDRESVGNVGDPDLSHLTDEDRASLARSLAEYHKAVREEFLTTQADRARFNSDEDIDKLILAARASSAKEILWLAENATSESVRLNALKWIQSEAFKISNLEGSDPFKNLLKELAGNDKKKEEQVETN
jgi:hypothetical protein